MAWLESHQELARHPKTRRLVRLLGVSTPTVIEHLHCLWWWALDFAQDGDLAKFDAEDIAEGALWEGDPQVFVDMLVSAGFLDTGDGGSLTLHDWTRGRLSVAEQVSARRDWDSIAPRLSPIVFERDGHTCQYCGATTDLTVDHIIPLSRGGKNVLDNLRTACRSCNSSKGAQVLEEQTS